MNTTELVHFVQTGMRPRSNSAKPKLPPSYHQLVAPVRQSILCARHHLLSMQQHDGTWSGDQQSDASLASQLVFLRAYLAENTALLGETCEPLAAAILEDQSSRSGWSRFPDGPIDLSISVQAYFALKLIGHDLSDERLSRARKAIRHLGGADAADASTRFFLALLGQAPLTCCEGMIEANYVARCIEIERGVRELFVRKPSEWPVCNESLYSNGDAQQSLAWLNFHQLVRRRIRLHSLGCAADSYDMSACDQQILDLVENGARIGCERPRLRRESLADTATALNALGESGMSLDHEVVARAANWLRDPQRRQEWSGGVMDLVALVELLTMASDDRDSDGALPPDLRVTNLRSRRRVASRRRVESLARGAATVLHSLTQQILARQHGDGGWGIGIESSADVTGAVLIALAACSLRASPKPQAAIVRGVEFLRAVQRADGCWDSATGVRLIHGTSLAVRGLIATGVSVDDNAVAAGVNWLLAHQQATGGWGEAAIAVGDGGALDEYASTSATAVQTSWSLMALIAAGREESAAVRRAIDFLLEAQQDDGTWRESNFLHFDVSAGHWYRDNLSEVVVPLVALSRWAIAAARREAVEQTPVSLKLFGGFVAD